MFEVLERCGAPRSLFLSDASSGLRGVLVLDDLTLGPAAGGIRTRRYPSVEAAVEDAAALAKAMTIKCALAGLPAGGGKLVVIEHDGMDRVAAFRRLGQYIEGLGGLFRTAGDLGTTAQDLAEAARETQYVYQDESGLTAAAARGMLRCVEACAQHKGRSGVADLSVAVQGCGAIGAAVATTLADAGAHVVVADTDGARANAVADSAGARIVSPDRILTEDVDLIAPCAVGGVVTEALVAELRAWAVCGAANNLLSGSRAADALHARGIVHVPDPVASAGAVIEGIGRMVMALEDRSALIDALGATALRVLEDAARTNITPTEAARHMAGRLIRDQAAGIIPV